MSNKERIRRIILRTCGILFFLYLLSGVLLWYFQESLLLHPLPQPPGVPYSLKGSHREWMIPVTDKDSLHFIQFYSQKPSLRKGVILFFHGNRDNIRRYERYSTWLTGFGYEVWMMDYPGFGKSSGTLTEDRLYSDADVVYRMAAGQISSDSILIYGKSLGTGIAVELASRRNCRRLILETPYYSIPELAWFHFPLFPVKRMLRYDFPTYARLPQVQAPVTIFQGTRDRIVPYRHAQKLVPLLKSKDEFVTIKKGAHNNLADFPYYHIKLRALL